MTPQMRMRMANKGKGSFRAEGSVLWLYDAIASDDEEATWWGGISPNQFIAALAATTGPVTLRINSPGGSVFGAQAMVAAMRAHAQPITARIDSLAASAASVIAVEAAQLEIVQGGMLMIHKAWGMALGNEDDMRQTADLLAKIDLQIADSYARRKSTARAGWLDLMKAETWFDAAEAVAGGLADRVIEENLQRPAARWDLSAYAAAPWRAGAMTMPDPAEAPEPFNDADVAFVRAMIPHHDAAVAMAKAVIGAGLDDDVAALAGAIIAAQITEIDDMEEWLAERGLPAAPEAVEEPQKPDMSALRQRQLAARLASPTI